MTPILLDTHAAVWATAGMLRPAVQQRIDAAARDGRLLLSPISAWEIGMLVGKGRLRLAVSTEHADPADRILAATAIAYGASLITRDRRLHGYARATKTFRCIAC